jgi:hypothetical protein
MRNISDKVCVENHTFMLKILSPQIVPFIEIIWKNVLPYGLTGHG